MDRVCIYPGSFDPLTVGHVDIIRRAANLFDRVIVAVLHNPAKTGCFPVEKRLEQICCACGNMANVSAMAYPGLLVDCVRETGACAVVRGLRSAQDYQAEETMAQINAMLLPGLETVFLLSRPEHACISSSAVRELAAFGGNICGFVPACNVDDVLAEFAGKAGV